MEGGVRLIVRIVLVTLVIYVKLGVKRLMDKNKNQVVHKGYEGYFSTTPSLTEQCRSHFDQLNLPEPDCCKIRIKLKSHLKVNFFT